MTRIVALLLALTLPAYAEPPDGVDLTLAPWYKSLQAADGRLCCSVADCRTVEARQFAGHWQVFIDQRFPAGDNAWHDVPEDAILHKQDNPTGSAVACWYMQSVRCFVQPIES